MTEVKIETKSLFTNSKSRKLKNKKLVTNGDYTLLMKIKNKAE